MSAVRPVALASVTGLALTAVVGGAANAAPTEAPTAPARAVEPMTVAAQPVMTIDVPDIAWDLEEITATAEGPAAEPAVEDAAQAADRSESRAEIDGASTIGAAAALNAAGSDIASIALALTGIPYVYAGESLAGLDCSGLVKYAYAQVGINLPHSSSAQAAGGTIVSDPQPGDIVAYPGHVAIYIGGGQMVEATVPGALSRVSAVRGGGYYVRY
ncbi:NlpC/P60 family protein [Actinomyces sp. B33]|uniref:C40 family peptidase n=1 Tax=Actinomyces sp. B33 TaxID=2942131 RepID=UPI002340A3DA|nr:C40 family peptidase [Actinomyces sp. B33]MDC4232196.1 NlpC/P60 family protein [Actinomyces sp. B33]